MKKEYRWLEDIICKLSAEKAKDLSDSELEKHLSPCVCGHHLVKLAKKYRDDGVLMCKNIQWGLE